MPSITRLPSIDTRASPAWTSVNVCSPVSSGVNVPELRLPESLQLRFVFPHAPVRPVTINGGMEMRAWYDILSLDRGGQTDDVGIRESALTLHGLISREQERGIPGDKIVVAGFSQGGAIALHAALRSTTRLGGLMALSTYLPMPELLASEVLDKPEVKDLELPVFMAHGTFDPVLPFQLGETSYQQLAGAGYTVDWHEYPMAHAVCGEVGIGEDVVGGLAEDGLVEHVVQGQIVAVREEAHGLRHTVRGLDQSFSRRVLAARRDRYVPLA